MKSSNFQQFDNAKIIFISNCAKKCKISSVENIKINAKWKHAKIFLYFPDDVLMSKFAGLTGFVNQDRWLLIQKK